MYHEERSKISDKTQDMKRAIDSLREELEAIDWYHQREEACTNDELKKILKHNADEEKEHAAMLMEWIRRNDEEFSKHMKDYLFTTKDIVEKEEEKK